MDFESKKEYIPNRIEIKCDSRKLGTLTSMMTNTGYCCTVDIDPEGVYIIEFDFSCMKFGGLAPMWVTEDEIHSISSNRQDSIVSDEDADYFLFDPDDEDIII